MARTRPTNGLRIGVAGAVLLLALLAQGCEGGSQSGGAVEEPPGAGSRAGGAEVAAVRGAAEVDGAGRGFDRMVVKTAELGIRADDVRAGAEEAAEISARFGGDVLSSRIYGGEGPVRADLVLTVPSGEFEAALDGLRELGRQVTTDSVAGQDVTEEFVDLESRERNLLAAEESLLGLYDRAESVDDTLEVQRELTGVRGRIEEVQGRIQYLEDRAATARISLTISPISAAAPQQAWDPSLVASRAWEASLRVLQTGATALISAAVFSWWLVPVLVAGLLWWRRYRTTRPANPPGR